MNQLGQEFSGFRLLVDAVLVLLILAIILGILGWVESLRFQVSERRLFEGFNKAVSTPNGKTVVEKNLVLREGSLYSGSSFQRPSVPKDCIEFDALSVTSLAVDPNRRFVSVKGAIQLDVFYRCQRTFTQGCEIRCEVSFGKDFDEPMQP